MVAVLEIRKRTALKSTLLLFVSLTGCSLPSTKAPASTPSAVIHVHSYFAAYAFLDANGNGQADPADEPIQEATFIVALPGGTEFGSQTDGTGYAFITIPAAVEYPVTLRMEAPKDSTWKAIEPSTITLLEATGEPTRFLFSSE